MKVGDLVIMPGEKLMTHDPPSIGVIVTLDDPKHAGMWPGKRKRVGVVWRDSDCIDFEPMEWLEVISEGG